MKRNFLALPRAELKTETVSIDYPGDDPVVMTLQRLDPYRATLAIASGEAFAETYRENYFPMPDGEAVKITLEVAQQLAAFEQMQVVDDEADRYTCAELLGLMVRLPDQWGRLIEVAGKLNATSTEEPYGGND